MKIRRDEIRCFLLYSIAQSLVPPQNHEGGPKEGSSNANDEASADDALLINQGHGARPQSIRSNDVKDTKLIGTARAFIDKNRLISQSGSCSSIGDIVHSSVALKRLMQK